MCRAVLTKYSIHRTMKFKQSYNIAYRVQNIIRIHGGLEDTENLIGNIEGDGDVFKNKKAEKTCRRIKRI